MFWGWYLVSATLGKNFCEDERGFNQGKSWNHLLWLLLICFVVKATIGHICPVTVVLVVSLLLWRQKVVLAKVGLRCVCSALRTRVIRVAHTTSHLSMIIIVILVDICYNNLCLLLLSLLIIVFLIASTTFGISFWRRKKQNSFNLDYNRPLMWWWPWPQNILNLIVITITMNRKFDLNHAACQTLTNNIFVRSWNSIIRNPVFFKKGMN